MYGVSCLAMLANFLSGLELGPAQPERGAGCLVLGAAETNEMRARLDIPSFQVTQ